MPVYCQQIRIVCRGRLKLRQTVHNIMVGYDNSRQTYWVSFLLSLSMYPYHQMLWTGGANLSSTRLFLSY